MGGVEFLIYKDHVGNRVPPLAPTEPNSGLTFVVMFAFKLHEGLQGLGNKLVLSCLFLSSSFLEKPYG